MRLCTEEKDHAKAIADCTALIRERGVDDWHLARAYLRRAVARMEDPFERRLAGPDLEMAISLDPRFHSAHYLRARLRDEEGDFAGAVAGYGEAIRLNPKHVASYNARGRALSSLERYGEAIADLEAAIRLNPRARAARYNRGFMAVGEGRFHEALEHFRVAAREASGPEDFERAAHANSDYPQLWIFVAAMRAGSAAQLDEARAALARRLERGGGDSYRPVSAYYLGRIDEAALRAAMAQSLACDLDYFVAQRLLAGADAARGRELLRRVAESCPANQPERWAARLELRRPRAKP